MTQKLMKTGLVCAGSGLFTLAALLISGAAYPDPLFRALAPLSILLLFASLPLLAGAWVLTIRREWKAHNRRLALISMAAGLLLCLYELSRIL